MDNILHQLERRLVNSTQSVDLSGGWFWNSEKNGNFNYRPMQPGVVKAKQFQEIMFVCVIRALCCFGML